MKSTPIASGSRRRPSLPGRRRMAPDVGDERGVVGVDRVRIRAPRGVSPRTTSAPASCEERAKGLVLGRQPGRDRAPRASRRPARPPGARGRGLDEHALEPSGHALTPKRAGGNLHRVETTARLAGLEAGGGCAAKYAAGRLEELLAGFAPGRLGEPARRPRRRPTTRPSTGSTTSARSSSRPTSSRRWSTTRRSSAPSRRSTR